MPSSDPSDSADRPDPLDARLDAWPDPTGTRPSLRPEVWRRIAHAEDRLEGLRGWDRLDAWLGRPVSAALFITSCALLGLFLAELRVNQEEHARTVQLVRSYIQLIDPLIEPAAMAKTP